MTWQPERPAFGAYEHDMPYVPRGTETRTQYAVASWASHQASWASGIVGFSSLTAPDCLSLMQQHHDTAIAYLRRILQQYRVLPSPSPTPRSKPRRAPQRGNTAGLPTPPDPTSHKRALPATPSVITRSVKRAGTNRMLCQPASPCPDSAPCTVRPWDRLIFSIGKNTGSMRRLKRRTRSDHTKLRAQDSAVHLPSSPQRSTAPHTVPPPPASHTSGCTTTAPAQTSMERVCLDTQPHNSTTSAKDDLLFESEFEPASDYPVDTG